MVRYLFGWLFDWFLDSKSKMLWAKEHWIVSLIGFLLFLFIL